MSSLGYIQLKAYLEGAASLDECVALIKRDTRRFIRQQYNWFRLSNPQIHWIRVLQMEKTRGMDLVDSNAYYNPETVPEEGHFYVPVACQQCRNPPCTRVCPTRATWQDPDGIVVIDYDWCIGCRCCIASCPYGARHFNWAEPTLEALDFDTARLAAKDLVSAFESGLVDEVKLLVGRPSGYILKEDDFRIKLNQSLDFLLTEVTD